MSRIMLPQLLLSCLTAMCLAGCGGGDQATQPVSGTVTYADGSPVSGGTIMFVDAANNSSSVGYIQADGTYTLGTFEETDGAPAGKYRVTVIGESEYGKSSPIDPQFGDRDRSPLEAEVTSGKNTLDFQVKAAR